MSERSEAFIRFGGRPEDVERFADAHDLAELAEPLRSRVYTAIQDCPRPLRLYLVSGRRSPWQQFLLRVERVGLNRSFNRNYPGIPRTAIPYSSQHQLGKAADLGGTGLAWLLLRYRRYGLAKTVSTEKWHYEGIGTPTVRIIPFPGSRPPTPIPTPDEEFTVDPEARAEFDALKADVSEIKGGLMKMQAFLNEARDDWWKPSTMRTRLIARFHGIKDET